MGSDDVVAEKIEDIVNLAPLLKPSVLHKLSVGLTKKGIDISNIVSLAEYLNEDSVVALLENAAFDTISDELVEKLMPFLNDRSKAAVFQKILDGEMDWRLIKALLPYAEYMMTEMEAAVLEGALPEAVLQMIHAYIFGKEV